MFEVDFGVWLGVGCDMFRSGLDSGLGLDVGSGMGSGARLGVILDVVRSDDGSCVSLK